MVDGTAWLFQYCLTSMLLHDFCFSWFFFFFLRERVALVLSLLRYTDALLCTNHSHVLEKCLLKETCQFLLIFMWY